MPDIIIVDDFRPDAMKMRELALQESYLQGRGSPCWRNSKSYFLKGMRDSFEKLTGERITDWKDCGANGLLQLATCKEPIVIHSDDQRWAGVWYLTPEAPLESGTLFYRSKKTGCHRCPQDEELVRQTYGNHHHDQTAWEVCDRVANRFNRLVLWRGDLIHSSGPGFGHDVKDCRMVQVYFFEAQP